MPKTDPRIVAARFAFGTAIVLLLVKFVAYLLTGSKAVLSDAIESIINVVTSGFAMYSVAVSARPADADHPYGHGKIEAFSAGLEGGLIVLAAIAIFLQAIPAFLAPSAPTMLGTGLLLLLGAGLVNLGVGLYLLRKGKKLNSEALLADGHHLLTDFYTSAGVIVGLFLVKLTGLAWLDPFTACLVALHILYPGVKLMRRSAATLMDEADPELLARIGAAMNRIRQPGWLNPHKLRVIRSGTYHHVDLHIALPHYWPLERVHETEKEITSALLAEIGVEGDIMIHFDPCEPDYCPVCSLESCDDRRHLFENYDSWNTGRITGPRRSPKQEGKKKT